MIIKIGLATSQLFGDISSHLKYTLQKTLSYENKGHIIQRMKAKKQYGYIPKKLAWDGLTHLFTNKNTFPTGLLEFVEQILIARGIDYTILDDNKVPNPVDIPLNESINYWPHQRAIIDAIKENKRGVIRAGTGAGKTIAAIGAIQEVGQLPALFIVNRVSLLKQAHKEFSDKIGMPIGFIGDGEMQFGQINIATVHTICSILKIDHEVDEEDKKENINYSPEQIKMLQALLKACKFVIIDECHHAASDMYIKLMNNLPNAIYRIGLSATPFLRNDGLNILVQGAFGRVIFDISATELIKREILVTPHITFVDMPKDPLTEVYKLNATKKSQYGTVYKNCVVENAYFNEIIAKLAIVSSKLGESTLISVKQIKHGENILNAVKKVDSTASVEFLHGQNKHLVNEAQIMEDFTNGKIKILISTLLDEGVDIKTIDTIIDAGGGVSAIKTLQVIGRAIRKYPGKERARIFLFVQRFTHLYNHSVERLNIVQSEPAFVINLMEWDK